jgi:hypothetical protein
VAPSYETDGNAGVVVGIELKLNPWQLVKIPYIWGRMNKHTTYIGERNDRH